MLQSGFRNPWHKSVVFFTSVIFSVFGFFLFGGGGGGRYRNQNVAIKIVHRGETPEEKAKREARFMREAAMLSRVQHKNLVKVIFAIWNLLLPLIRYLIVKNGDFCSYFCVLLCSVRWGMQGACDGCGH